MSNGMLQVLLSTYNGEKYILQQLDSIFAQRYDQLKVLIRDDGSRDQTLSIIRQYMEQYPDQIELIMGENVGVVRSFWTLMEQADQQAEYFCFCDQDDVWMPDKIAHAIEQLSQLEHEVQDTGEENSVLPAMMCTATQLTDEELQPTVIWPGMPSRPPSFYNALFQNIAVGATLSFNRNALQLILSVSVNTERILMHDWWFYLAISCFGRVYFDPNPSIYYRQHASNAVGGEATWIQKLKKKLGSFKKHNNNQLLVEQAKEFYRLYGEQITDVQMLEQLQAFIAPRPRFMDKLRYVNQCKLYRQSLAETLLFRFLILIGYL